jgi:hypothetical protein
MAGPAALLPLAGRSSSAARGQTQPDDEINSRLIRHRSFDFVAASETRLHELRREGFCFPYPLRQGSLFCRIAHRQHDNLLHAESLIPEVLRVARRIVTRSRRTSGTALGACDDNSADAIIANRRYGRLVEGAVGAGTKGVIGFHRHRLPRAR